MAALVHHVAIAYPLEIDFARTLAKGQPVACITWTTIDAWNAQQGEEFATVAKEDALALLRKNSQDAAEAVSALNDEELDSAAPISVYGNAPLTAQFFIEDHAVRHSYHHLANIRAVFSRTEEPAQMLRIAEPA